MMTDSFERVGLGAWSTTSSESLPVTREIWVAIQELFALQKSVQLGGVEGRKKAIRCLLARRRYCA